MNKEIRWAPKRWWHYIYFIMSGTVTFLGFLYVGLYFLLNSTFLTQILTAQMNALFYGQYHFESIHIDARFSHLKLLGVVIKDPDGGPLIDAEQIDLHFEMLELLKNLVMDNHLDLPQIDLKNPRVFLDFSRPGHFNLLRALSSTLPPTPEEPSDFKLHLRSLNVYHGQVTLDFGTFEVELRDLEVHRFGLGIDGIMTMHVPIVNPAFKGLWASQVNIRINPRMFGFDLAYWGPSDRGLILSEGGEDTGAWLHRIYQRSGTALMALVHKQPKIRGPIVLNLKDLKVDGFWWKGAQYGYHSLTTHFGPLEAEGRIEMSDSMMDLSPLDTIGYDAILHLILPLNGSLMTYFIGPDLQSHSDLDLKVHIAGDFNHAKGSLGLKVGPVLFQQYAIDGLEVQSKFDGQHVDIEKLELLALEDRIAVQGWMDLFDLNLDLDLSLGEMHRGLHPGIYLPKSLKEVDGYLSTHFRIQKNEQSIRVYLSKAIQYEFVKALPYSGARHLFMGAYSKDNEPWIAWDGSVLELSRGLLIKAGEDRLSLGENLRVTLDPLKVENLDLALKTGNLGRFRTLLGAPSLKSGPIELKLQATGALASTRGLRGQVNFKMGSIQYAQYRLNEMTLHALLNEDRIDLKTLKIRSPYGSIDAEGWAKVFDRNLQKIRASIPIQADVQIVGLDLSKVGPLMGQDLSGQGDLALKIRGTSRNPEVYANAEIRSFRGYGEYLPKVKTQLSFVNQKAKVEDFEAWIGQKGAALGLNIDFDLKTKVFALKADLKTLKVEDLGSLKDLSASLGLKGEVQLQNFELRGDADLFTGGLIEQPLEIQGKIALKHLKVMKMHLGNVEFRFYRKGPYLFLTGDLLNLLKLRAKITRERPWIADLTLSLYRWPILELLPKFLPEFRNVHWGLLKSLEMTGDLKAHFDERTGLNASVEFEKIQAQLGKRLMENQRPIQIFYKDNRVTIQSFDFGPGDQQIRLKGWAQTDGALDLRLFGVLDASLLGLLPGITRQALGTMAMDLRVQGALFDAKGNVDLNGLNIGGQLRVDQPIAMQLRALSGSSLELSSGEIQISNQGVWIPNQSDKMLKGKVLGGDFSIHGAFRLSDMKAQSATLSLRANHLTYRLPGMLSATVDIPELKWEMDRFKDIRPGDLRLSGSVEIIEGRFFKDYNLQDEFLRNDLFKGVLKGNKRVARIDTNVFRKVPLLKKIELDITALCEDRFFISNKVAGNPVYLELGFDLHAMGYLDDLKLDGLVNIEDGYFTFNRRKFELQPNSQLQFNNSLLPVLDISAQAEINTQQSFSTFVSGTGTQDQRRRIHTSDFQRASSTYLITLILNGPVDELKPELTSTPTLSSNDIMTLILTGRTLDQLNANNEDDPTLDFVIQTLLAPLLETQVGNVISADAFKFSISDGGAQLLYLEQITHQLSVVVGVRLAGADGDEQALGGEYRLNDQLSLELMGQSDANDVMKLDTRIRYHQPLGD